MMKYLISSLYRKLVITKRHYRRHIKPYPHLQKCYITCTGKNDGAGAQALAILSTQLFAYDTGIKYVHIPFQKIQHNNENNPDWEKDWEEFFGLGEGELKISQLDLSGINYLKISDISQIPLNASENLYIVSQCHDYANLFPNRYKSLKEKLLEKYQSFPKQQYQSNMYDYNQLSIVLHIRRGDINSKGKFSERYTSNDEINCILQNIISIISNYQLKLSISIYSQGQPEDFKEIIDKYRNYNTKIYLDECVFKAFHALVNADILLMSKSTFSYTAALLSSGIKIYEPFYHPPLDDWLICDRKYSFNRVKFQKALQYFLSQKKSFIPF
ncbi:MAG: alpha-1,2-fucosyltransferase [Nostoc sp.]|uniref:alpha-1,2-fucosyltransferase n=1 Tax=Nostoc sp. TaxID=1180 RepID=UPI002FF03E3E